MATVNLSGIITPANVLTASNAETLTNKTINIASNTLTGVQSTLVSGTSIKTVNSTSLLGSGDIALSSALTLLSTVTASGVATADIETTFNSTYSSYLLVASGITSPILANVQLRVKLSGAYVTTSTYSYHISFPKSSSNAYSGSHGGNSNIHLATIGLIAGSSANLTLRISNPTSTTLTKLIGWSGECVVNDSGDIASLSGAGAEAGTGALTGLRFFLGDSALITGTFRLYGIANS